MGMSAWQGMLDHLIATSMGIPPEVHPAFGIRCCVSGWISQVTGSSLTGDMLGLPASVLGSGFRLVLAFMVLALSAHSPWVQLVSKHINS